MGKKISLACAVAVLVVGAFAVGMRVAMAQSGLIEVGAIDNDSMTFAAVVGRTVYYGQGLPVGNRSATPPVPGSSRIVAAQWDETAVSVGVVLLENGDVYHLHGTWVYDGNVLSGATAARPSSWGAIKVGQ